MIFRNTSSLVNDSAVARSACPTFVPQEGANGARKCKQFKVCNGEYLRKNAKVLIDKDHGIRFPS